MTDVLSALDVTQGLKDMLNEQVALSQYATKSHLKAVHHALKGTGVTQVDLVVDGCGDEGGLESWVYRKGTEEVSPEQSLEYDALPATVVRKSGSPETDTKTVEACLEEIGYQALAACGQSGWEINDGSYNEINIDVEKRSATVSHQYRYTELSDPQIGTVVDDLEDFCVGEENA